MYTTTDSNRETPMKRILRALRGPFVGAYGTRFHRPIDVQSPLGTEQEGPVGRGVLGQGSVVDHGEQLESLPSDDRLKSRSEFVKDGAMDTSRSMIITPAIVQCMKEITSSSKRLCRLTDRSRNAKFERINVEHKLENMLNERQDEELNGIEDAPLDKELERMETAYKNACVREASHVTSISNEEARIRSLREDLESLLQDLVLPFEASEKMRPDADSVDESVADDNTDVDVDTQEVGWDAGPEDFEARPTPEEQERIAARDRFDAAKAHLESLYVKFDNQPAFYEMDLATYLEAVDNGQCVVPRTEFDLHHLGECQGLTQDLREAEDGYDIAATDAMVLGAIQQTASQTSFFVDQPEDGHESEIEVAGCSVAVDFKAIKGRTNTDRIEQWQEQLREEIASQDKDDVVDDWDAKTIEFGESMTTVADGRHKVKIERWEQFRFQLWQSMQAQDFSKPGPVLEKELPRLPSQGIGHARGRARSCKW